MAFIVPAIAAVGSAIGIGGTAAATTGAAAGILGTGITLSQVMTGIGLLGSAVSAVGQYSQGQAMAAANKLQATNAIIEGNRQAMEYQRQGIQVLSRTAETDAMIKARAGAGGIDPFSGSAGALSDYAFLKGADEYTFASENATSAILAGQANAASYRAAASSASRSGLFNAIATVGSAALTASRLDVFGKTTATSLAQYPAANVPLPPARPFGV